MVSWVYALVYSKIISEFMIHVILRPHTPLTIHRLNNPVNIQSRRVCLIITTETQNYDNNLDQSIKNSNLMHICFIKHNNLNTNTGQWTRDKRIQISQHKYVTWDSSVTIPKPTFTVIVTSEICPTLTSTVIHIKKQLQRPNISIKRWENDWLWSYGLLLPNASHMQTQILPYWGAI